MQPLCRRTWLVHTLWYTDILDDRHSIRLQDQQKYHGILNHILDRIGDNFSIFFKVTSLAREQSYHIPQCQWTSLMNNDNCICVSYELTLSCDINTTKHSKNRVFIVWLHYWDLAWISKFPRILLSMWLLIHAGIKMNHVSKGYTRYLQTCLSRQDNLTLWLVITRAKCGIYIAEHVWYRTYYMYSVYQ